MIDIPPELTWLGYLVGVDLPEADEDALFAMGRAWKEAARAIAAQVDPLAGVRQKATGAYTEGAGAETIAALFADLLDGDDSLSTLAAHYDELGNAAFDFGTTVQAAKLMMIVSYALLLAEILWAWMFPPTAPAVEAAAIAGTRSSLRRVEDLVITRIEQLILKSMGAAGTRQWVKLVAKNVATYGVKGTVSGLQSVLIDLGVQGGQMAAGTRREIHGNEMLLSFGASFAGGLFGRPAAHWGGIAFDASLGRLTNSLGRAADVARGAAIGAFGGAAGTIGGALAQAMNSGDWQRPFAASAFGLGAAGGAFRGGVVGGTRGLTHLAQVPRSAARTGFLRHFQLDAEGNVYVPASKVAAIGGAVSDHAVPRPAPVDRSAVGDPAEPTPRQRRALAAFDRQDAANMREYQRLVRESQPTLRAEPRGNPARAGAAGNPHGDNPDEGQAASRARAVGVPEGAATAERQPAWASRMSDRAQSMQHRADAAQRTADHEQAAADRVQARASNQQTKATAEENLAAQARAEAEQTRQQLGSAEDGLARARAAHGAESPQARQEQQRVERARVVHGTAEHVRDVRRLAADAHQRAADRFQSLADEAQGRADRAQRRADDLRMVRVAPEVVDLRADAEATPTIRPIRAEAGWWERALLRSEQLGKQYGTGGPGTDHYQAKGTDLRAKTRPKLEHYHQPALDTYIAPVAPDAGAWGRAGDPHNPEEPTDPGDPANPTDPGNPGDPRDPGDPGNPGGPQEPSIDEPRKS